MTTITARAKQLRDEAHELYLKAVEYRAAGYALEQAALDLVSEKRVVLVAPAISPVNEPAMQLMENGGTPNGHAANEQVGRCGR